MGNKARLGLFILGCTVTASGWADPLFFPTQPGVTITGYTGNGWTALGDTLVPLLGESSHFTYIDPQIFYHSQGSQDQYSSSVGLGQRWLTGDNIWGAYLFGDYNHTQENNSFWFLSPGLERLGKIWDFSLNGYLPVSNQRLSTGTEFADQAGDYSQVSFSGNNQYDEIVNTYESTGFGADAKVSARLPFKNIKLSVGSYYLAPKDCDEIIGAVMQTQVPINRYVSVLASEAYDNNAHNTIKVGLSISLGGRSSGADFTGDLNQRLVDPVQRQLIAVGDGSSGGEPVVDTFTNTGRVGLETANISFFVPGSTPDNGVNGDGTFENPYQGFSQANINDANQKNNHNFYLNSGAYNAEYAADNDKIVLNDDQLYGRQDNFVQPAQENNQPVLNFSQSGLTVSATDSLDKVTGLTLVGSGTGAGIDINLVNDHPDITVDVKNSNISGFNYGILINNAANSKATINIFASDITHNLGQGIQAQNESSGGLELVVDNTNINNNGASGIYLSDYSAGNLTANIIHSNISNNANNGIYGINEFNNDTLTLNIANSTIANNAYNGVQLYNGTGAYNTNSGNVVANINGSSITGNSQNGIIASNTSTGSFTLNVSNSNIADNIINGIEAVNISGAGDFVFNLRQSTVDGNGVNGLETFNQESNGSFTLTINQSVIENNGDHGVFIDNTQSSGNLTANIIGSRINNNNMDGIYALNDLSTGDFTLSLIRSSVVNNLLTGLFLDNKGNSSLFSTHISASTVSGNGINGISAVNEGEDSQLNLSVIGSLIADNTNGIILNEAHSAGSLTASISHSAIINNSGKALSANNGAVATLDTAVVAGNAGGIASSTGGVINVNNPVYFDANLTNHGGTINFNGVAAPINATHAYCTMGVCFFTSPTGG